MWIIFPTNFRPANYNSIEVEDVEYEDLSKTITENEKFQEIYF